VVPRWFLPLKSQAAEGRERSLPTSTVKKMPCCTVTCEEERDGISDVFTVGKKKGEAPVFNHLRKGRRGFAHEKRKGGEGIRRSLDSGGVEKTRNASSILVLHAKKRLPFFHTLTRKKGRGCPKCWPSKKKGEREGQPPPQKK